MGSSEGMFAADELYYQSWQVDDPRATVVLSHGYAEHSGRYGHVAAALNVGGFDVWALDHRGHGRSQGERGNVGSVAGAVVDLDAFVDLVTAAAPVAPLFLVGHSMGGLIATAYAEEHQPRLQGLALSGALLHVAPEILALGESEEIPDLGLADAVSSDPAVVQAYKDDPLNYLGPPPRAFFAAAGELAGVVARLGELTLPLLVMHGSADLLVNPQAFRDVVANAGSEDITARLWPGLWHEIFNEPRQADVLALLVGWLDAQLA